MRFAVMHDLFDRNWSQPALTAAMAVLAGTIIVTLLLLPIPFRQVQLEAGEVVPQNIVSPRKIIYDSAIATEEARERAAQAVPKYYDPPQSRVRRQQVSRSYEILEFITALRNDTVVPVERRTEAILSIEDLDLTPSIAQEILGLSAEEWQVVGAEVPLVLDQVMREDIKEDALPAVRRRIPALVSPDLSAEAGDVVTELVQGLVQPNSFFNLERTEELRQQARESVSVQTQTLEQGEVILRAGDIADVEDIEALEQLGLHQRDWNWWKFVQASLVSAVLITLVVGTISRLRPQCLTCRREMGLLLLLSVVGLVMARLMIVPSDWLPYLFPLAALGMLAVLLLDLQAAVTLILSFTLFVAYLSNGNVTLIFYSSVGALFGTLVLGKADRLTAFLWAGLAVMVGSLAVLIALWTQPLELITTSQVLRMLLLVALNGGLSTSVALIGYFILGNLFGITTNLQLMELSRPTHPLLRQLLLKAPGTYHHTILVSNLAERAAEAIGADAFLIRVGAYYHDIGKIVRPYFFMENSVDDSSPHAGLDAKTSAQIIISHVKDGADLARKYRLPAALQDFIWQHHGAQVMNYFYQQAKEQAGEDEEVDIEEFRYPGPDPQSKEAAIMMLADTCEAAVRAERPATREDLESMVDELIMGRVSDGALDQSDLTFRELQIVRRIFVQVLQGVHHPRIKYPSRPEGEKEPAPLVPIGAAIQPNRGRNGVIPERVRSNGHHADGQRETVSID